MIWKIRNSHISIGAASCLFISCAWWYYFADPALWRINGRIVEIDEFSFKLRERRYFIGVCCWVVIENSALSKLSASSSTTKQNWLPLYVEIVGSHGVWTKGGRRYGEFLALRDQIEKQNESSELDEESVRERLSAD